MNKRLVSPSVLSANFASLGTDIAMLNQSECDWIHIDVMDGSFVPNISFGQPVVKHIAKLASKPLDLHLMIEQPDRYLADFQALGVEIATVHYEACRHLNRTLHAISELGMRPAVALNPHTPVSLLEDIIDDCYMVLLMSVNPGFGGQKFIDNTYRKIVELRKLCERHNPECLIEVDGGVNLNNAANLFEAGANVLVAGNAVFSAEQPLEVISQMKRS